MAEATAYAVIGTREYMQDAFSVRLSQGEGERLDFFGVFDGKNHLST